MNKLLLSVFTIFCLVSGQAYGMETALQKVESNTIIIDITKNEADGTFDLNSGKITVPEKELLIPVANYNDASLLTKALNEQWLSCTEKEIATPNDFFTFTLKINDLSETTEKIALSQCLHKIISKVTPEPKAKPNSKRHTWFGAGIFAGLVVGGTYLYLNKTNPELVKNFTNQAQRQLNNFLLNGQFYFGKLQNELNYLYNKLPACKFTWPSFFGRK
ncbi:MAG: hypothetical protein WDZ41_04585 [Candidatus Babeliales bacterium]